MALSNSVKNRLFLSGLIIVVSYGFYAWWNKAHWPIQNWPRPLNTIVAFGDSLTRGYGAKRGHDYPTILSEKIGRQIINRGVDGDTTHEAIMRLDADVLSLKPDMVLICLGGNDIMQRTPASELGRDMGLIIDRIQQSGAVVVLIEVKGPLGMNYGDMFEELAREKGCIFVPNVLRGILTHPKLKKDQIHPNTAGYLKMMLRIYDVLEPYVN